MYVDYVAHPGLEFRNEKGKASLALNIAMFFRVSRPVCRAPRPILNLSLCTVAISILESLKKKPLTSLWGPLTHV